MRPFYSPLTLVKNFTKPTVGQLKCISKNTLFDIVGKRKNISQYIVKEWDNLSYTQREGIYLHSIKTKFAPKENCVKLGRWGYTTENEKGEYPW